MMTDDGRHVEPYPALPHMRAFKWRPGLSFYPYHGRGQAFPYVTEETQMKARNKIRHWCFYTKQMEREKKKMVGILLFIFGDEYDKIGSACLRFSRQHTSLPVHVVTNIRQSDRWKGLDVSFQYVDVPTKDNRDVKTQMYKYTPFHRTLYMDCDAVVQNPGLEDVFSLLDGKDVALYRFDRWEKGHKVLSLYKEAMQMFDVGLPLNIWQGGLPGLSQYRREHTVVQALERLLETIRATTRDALPCVRGEEDEGSACLRDPTTLLHG